MSRPLTGSKKPTSRGWQASLPLHRGATRRATWTFVDEPASGRWLTAGRAAIAAGEPLPTPDQADLAAGTGRPAGTSFTTMAQAWCQENYAELWRGGPDRERTVRGHIRRIAAFMDERGLTLEGMRRDQVKALQASLTRATAPTAAVRVPEGLDPEALVTMHEALALPGMASRSTLKRRVAAGALSPAEEGVNGHRYRIADLYVEAVLGPPGRGLRRGPRRAGSMSQDVANDVLWVFTRVCLFSEDHGVAVPQDRKSLKMHRTDRAEAPTRRVVPLATCADIASRLHAVHQPWLTIW